MKHIAHFLPLAALGLADFQQPIAQVPLEPSEILSPVSLTLDAIPLLGFGTWNLDRSNATEAVSWAIQTGYRHIDCATAYGNEELVGNGIADGLAKVGLSRQDIWVTSKLWNDHHDPALVEEAIDTSLRKLNLAYLDLWHMHWPVTSNPRSGKNSIGYLDTYTAMTTMLDKGKTRHIGISNFDPLQLKSLLNRTSRPPSVHQMELHPYLQQKEWLKFHEEHGIHVTAYSPLGGTNPTYSPGEDPQLLNNTVVTTISKKRGCTPAQVALQWGMSRGTSVIPKSSHKEYISENFESLQCVLEGKDIEKLNKLGSYHHRYNNPSKGWKVDLYEGLEDSKGERKEHS